MERLNFYFLNQKLLYHRNGRSKTIHRNYFLLFVFDTPLIFTVVQIGEVTHPHPSLIRNYTNISPQKYHLKCISVRNIIFPNSLYPKSNFAQKKCGLKVIRSGKCVRKCFDTIFIDFSENVKTPYYPKIRIPPVCPDCNKGCSVELPL